MHTNYKRISEDNIKRRGTEFEEVGRFLSKDLYSDKTHFIYELLQNVEDALERRDRDATNSQASNEVNFKLFKDRLEMYHFGTLFDEDDVRGISDILSGTKTDDHHQIGKFGIGFKSVYAFTSSPEIHSGDEHFKITKYIIPSATTSKVDLSDGETCIILPFNHQQVSQEESFNQILNRLSSIGLRTLLFLKNIDKISWSSKDEEGIYLKKTDLGPNNMRNVLLKSKKNNNIQEEEWLVFSKPIRKKGRMHLDVEIAYKFEKDDGTLVIKPINKSPLFAYFPTNLETNFKFLIQGPFNTTAGRDNINTNDDWNLKLIETISNLVVESLLKLRKAKLLTINVIQIMPIQEENFPTNNIFRPIYDKVLKAFQEKPLLPTDGGEYIQAKESKLAQNQGLKKLLDTKALQDLLQEEKLAWLTSDITRDKTPQVRKYLLEKLDVEEINPEKFGRKIDGRFLKNRSDQWMTEFYSFLNGQRALWQKYRWGTAGVRNKPIIRMKNSDQISPFNKNDDAQVYLMPKGGTDFPVVKPSIAKNKESKKFLKNLGLEEPDVVDEIKFNLIPKYKQNDITQKENLKDVKKIIEAYQNVSKNKREKLIKLIRKLRFLLCCNQENMRKEYRSIGDIYLINKNMEKYFTGNPQIWGLDSQYYKYEKDLIDLGVKNEVAIKIKEPNHENYVSIEDRHSNHTRGVDRFDPNCHIDGLKFALENPTRERSCFIWNQLLQPRPYLIKGEIEKCTRQGFDKNVKTEIKKSRVGKLLSKYAWIPVSEDVFKKPTETSMNNLPNNFNKDKTLACKLDMLNSKRKTDAIKNVAEKAGMPEDTLAKLIKLYTDDPNRLEEYLKIRQLNKKHIEEDTQYPEELEKAFNKPGSHKKNSHQKHNYPIQNPKRRRKKTKQELDQNKQSEPNQRTRFYRAPRKVWNKKNNMVKIFLYEKYNGRCQICGDTFQKRNGEFYFEGLYLIPHTKKKWADRKGNVLCLCPTCCAKFLHGPVESDGILKQILSFKTKQEGGKSEAYLNIILCGKEVKIKYSERHFLDLQEIIKSDNN